MQRTKELSIQFYIFVNIDDALYTSHSKNTKHETSFTKHLHCSAFNFL